MFKMPFQKLDGLCRVNIHKYEVKSNDSIHYSYFNADL